MRAVLLHTLKVKPNVVPVLTRGFPYLKTLPPDIDQVRFMSGPQASTEYSDAFVNKLCEYFVGAHPFPSGRSALLAANLLRLRSVVRRLLNLGAIAHL